MSTEASGVTTLAAESAWTRARGRQQLRPVKKRWPWITGGLTLQALAVAATIAWLAERIKHDGLTGQALKATVMLVWHEMLMTKSGVAVLAASGVLFVIGSMLAARPFVRSVVMLTVAVPIAAIVGLVALGAIALVVAVAVMLAGVLDNLPGGGGGGSGRDKKKKGAGVVAQP